MPYKIAIRKNETNEVRLYTMNNDWDSRGIWWWTEGNGGCDCNRKIFFENHENDIINKTHCSEGRFTLLYIELPDGTKIEEDIYDR